MTTVEKFSDYNTLGCKERIWKEAQVQIKNRNRELVNSTQWKIKQKKRGVLIQFALIIFKESDWNMYNII